MDSSTLVSTDVDIDSGRALLQRLEEHGLPIAAALWYYDPVAQGWRLLIATPTVDEAGPRQAYQLVQEVLGQLRLPRLSLANVGVLTPREPLIRALQAAFGNSPDAQGWLKGTSVNGLYIDQAYLYFAR